MHGRLKLKTTEQQKEEKKKKQQKKLELFQHALAKAFSKRKEQQFDDNALKLTTEILAICPDVYTLWNFRKEVILEFKNTRNEEDITKLVKDDLGFTELCLRNNPKSYSAWHHRYWVMMNTPNPDWEMELKICNQYLLLDERNFHCWDYRRFIVKEFGVSNKEEFEFSNEKILNNFSNYSAWHYRSKLLPRVHPGNTYKKIDESKLLEEFQLVQNAAFTDPNDQSAWFYHRWLLGRSESPPEVYSFLISKMDQHYKIVMAFSSPITIDHDNQLQLRLNEKKINLTWSSPDIKSHCDSSKVWMTNLPHGDLEHSSVVKVELEINGSVLFLSEIDGTKEENFQEGKILSQDLFRSNFSAATCSFIRDELESCNLLQEMEPDDKWPMLTSVFLMKAIDSQGFQSKIIDSLKQLSERIDVNRSMYYEDLRSRIIIENAIESKKFTSHELSIPNMDLTTLYHTHFLTELKKLDLRNNRLQKLPNAFHMQFLEELLLDDNRIEDCQGMEDLGCLRMFSAANNYLEDIQSISSTFSCNRLQYMNLKGNPVAEDFEKLKTTLVKCFNNIKIINEIEL